ncbi:MAG: hypothetical protein ACLPKT_10480 [Methylocella sp.]
MQPKQKKSAEELADMISARLNIGGVFITVHKDPAYGWQPTVVTRPAAALNAQMAAEEIAKELRVEFDLAA